MFEKIVGLIKKINRSSDVIIDFDKTLDFKIKSSHLLSAALISAEPITQPIKKGETELIVSFTTYNKRIHDVHLVVESIAQQTLKPNRLILWLDEDEFTLETIPLILQRQIERGLEIRFCLNYRSYKKLIPSIQTFPNANIVTIDDDFLYPHDMIEILLKEHSVFPKCILGHRAHKVMIHNNKVSPYIEWENEIQYSEANDFIFLTTGAGVFLPPHVFDAEVLNATVFLEICPFADDVWLNAMSLLSGIKRRKVNDDRVFRERFLPIPGSKHMALSEYNVDNGGNDKQLQAVFEKYDLLKYL